MQLATVIGHATSTIKHPTLHGWRLLIVQPMNESRKPDGVPLIALDVLGCGRGDEVIVTNEGKATRAMVGADNAPAQWSIVGLAETES